MADDETSARPLRRPIRGKLVAALVSTVAIAALVLHVADPRLRIDGITVGLLVVAIVPWLGDLIESVELPGGVKFEMRRLNRRMDAAQRSAAGAGREARMALLAAGNAPDVPPARAVFPPDLWNRPPAQRPAAPHQPAYRGPATQQPSRTDEESASGPRPGADPAGQDDDADDAANSRAQGGSPPGPAPYPGPPAPAPYPAGPSGPAPYPGPFTPAAYPGYGSPRPGASPGGPPPAYGSPQQGAEPPAYGSPQQGAAPRAPASPGDGGPQADDSDPYAVLVGRLCAEYGMLRSSPRAGQARTVRMDKVFAGLLNAVPRAAGFDTVARLASAEPGDRLAAYAGLYAEPNAALLQPLTDAALSEPVPYSQYWAFTALGHVLGTMNPGDVPYGVVRRLNAALDRMPLDADRVGALEQALAAAGA